MVGFPKSSHIYVMMFVCAFSFSGLPATEIHVCGSGIAVDVVKKIVESVGEQIEVKHYDRLLPLVTLNDSLGKYACKGQHTKTLEMIFRIFLDLEHLNFKVYISVFVLYVKVMPLLF